MAAKLLVGMNVIVLTGKKANRGMTGKILQIDREKNRVIVEGVNIVKRAVRPTQANPTGGFIEREASIHISNVAAIDPSTKRPTRVGFKIEDGVKVRVSRRSGEALPMPEKRS